MRDSSAVGGDAVLLSLLPNRVRAGWRTQSVAEAEAKNEVAANSEEVK